MNGPNDFNRSTPGIYSGSVFDLNGGGFNERGPALKSNATPGDVDNGVTKTDQRETNYNIRHVFTLRPSRIADFKDLDRNYIFAAMDVDNTAGYMSQIEYNRMMGDFRNDMGLESKNRLSRLKITKELTTSLTVPMLNYYLHVFCKNWAKNNENPNYPSIDKIMTLFQAVGTITTLEAERESNKGTPDARAGSLAGPVDIHNIWGYDITIGTHLYFLVKPKKMNDKIRTYPYSLSSSGDTRIVEYAFDSSDMPKYIYEIVPFYSCDGRDPPFHIYCDVKKDKIVTGSWIHIGQVHEPTKSRHMFGSVVKDSCKKMDKLKENPTVRVMCTQPSCGIVR